MPPRNEENHEHLQSAHARLGRDSNVPDTNQNRHLLCKSNVYYNLLNTWDNDELIMAVLFWGKGIPLWSVSKETHKRPLKQNYINIFIVEGTTCFGLWTSHHQAEAKNVYRENNIYNTLIIVLIDNILCVSVSSRAYFLVCASWCIVNKPKHVELSTIKILSIMVLTGCLLQQLNCLCDRLKGLMRGDGN
jgi:hypothetical protein